METRDELLLGDLLDERLDAATAAALRARMDTEPALRETWDELRRIRDVVRGASAERAPPDFLTRVRARIRSADAAASATTASDAATDEEAHPLDGPAGRLLVLPRRIAVAASALAALLLVALGVRWMGAGDRAEVQGTHRVLHSARAPERDVKEAQELEVARETFARPPARGARSSRAAAEGAPGAPPAVSAPTVPRAPAAPTPAPLPAGRVPAPRPAAGGFGPADAVPPGLRTPSDDAEVLDRAREPKRRGRQEKSGDALRLAPGAPPAAFTWTLEVADLPTGRARLALLVGGLDAAGGGEQPRLRSGRRGDDVLGSVLLCLSADEVAAWKPEVANGKVRDERGAADPDEGEDGEIPDAEARSAPCERRLPDPTPETDAEKADETEAGATAGTTAGTTAMGYRVRVLLVRAAAAAER